jgi:hypothetical protein
LSAGSGSDASHFVAPEPLTQSLALLASALPMLCRRRCAATTAWG